MLSPLLRKICYGELVVEASINVIQGLVSLSYPSLSLLPMSNDAGIYSDAGLEIARWWGGMIFTFGGYCLLRVLYPFNAGALRILLEALCLGDIVYLSALTPFAIKYGSLPGILAPYVLTVLMFISRQVLYWNEDWKGYEGDKKQAAEGALGLSSASTATLLEEPSETMEMS